MKRSAGLSICGLIGALVLSTGLGSAQLNWTRIPMEYREQWHMRFPPQAFADPHPDLKDEDIVLHHRIRERGMYRANDIELYVIDTVRGEYLSEYKVRLMDAFVKGYTVYLGNVWIVLGDAEEYRVGTKLLVLNARTGERVAYIDAVGYMTGSDMSIEMMPIGDRMYMFCTGSYTTPTATDRSTSRVSPFISVYTADTAEHIEYVSFREGYSISERAKQDLRPYFGEVISKGPFPLVLREHDFDFLDLRTSVHRTIVIGQPHVVYALGDDRYLAGWLYDPKIVHNERRRIFLTRVYHWVPGQTPVVLWDSEIDAGLGRIGGPLTDGWFWMPGGDDSILFFNRNFAGSLTESIRSPYRVSHIDEPSGMLYVLARNDSGEWVPALVRQDYHRTVKLVELAGGLINRAPDLEWLVPAGDGYLGYSERGVYGEVYLSFGRFVRAG